MSKPVIASELLNEVLRQFGRTAEVLPLTVSTTVSVPPRRVLLVEDNEINRRVALGLLRSRGHLVEIAENGQEALNMLAKHEFDVVLMDMQMPVMDGYEATAAIRAHEHEMGGHMPIVAMTAEALKGDRERCLAVGMDDYVAKPISQSEIYRAVERFPALCSPVPSRGPQLADKTVVQSSESVDSMALPETPRAPTTIDWKLARARLPEGTMTMDELVGLVKNETPNLLASIRQSIVSRDSKTLRRSAHTLKSSVSLLGADSLAQLAQILENLGRLESFEGIEELLSRLEKQFECFMKDLDDPPK
jgi:CheY-like chemotaxis protein